MLRAFVTGGSGFVGRNLISVVIRDHRIEISASLWSGRERVSCDGKVVSEKTSYFYVTPHTFELIEGNQTAIYEVNILTSWLGFDVGYIVRRNGMAIAHKP